MVVIFHHFIFHESMKGSGVMFVVLFCAPRSAMSGKTFESLVKLKIELTGRLAALLDARPSLIARFRAGSRDLDEEERSGSILF